MAKTQSLIVRFSKKFVCLMTKAENDR